MGFFFSYTFLNTAVHHGSERKSIPKATNNLSSQKRWSKKSDSRWVTNPGLGFKVPVEAREGHYVDKKCPFTGKVSIRGRILTGVITKMKMNRTVVIRRDYLHYVKKYNRFEKRHRNMSVHMS